MHTHTHAYQVLLCIMFVVLVVIQNLKAINIDDFSLIFFFTFHSRESFSDSLHFSTLVFICLLNQQCYRYGIRFSSIVLVFVIGCSQHHIFIEIISQVFFFGKLDQKQKLRKYYSFTFRDTKSFIESNRVIKRLYDVEWQFVWCYKRIRATKVRTKFWYEYRWNFL